jgi:hypothetical protein
MAGPIDPRPLANQIHDLLEASGATQLEQYSALAIAGTLVGWSKNPRHPDDLEPPPYATSVRDHPAVVKGAAFFTVPADAADAPPPRLQEVAAVHGRLTALQAAIKAWLSPSPAVREP